MKMKSIFIATICASVVTPAIVIPMAIEASSTFTDITTKHSYFKDIHTMRDLGIINGYPDGTFRPDEIITRKQVAALLNRAHKLPQTVNVNVIKDVPETHANYNDILAVQRAGVFDLDKNGNFLPNKEVTRAEMAKALVVAFNLQGAVDAKFPDMPKSHHAFNYVSILFGNEITLGNNGKFLPDRPLTRAHYAVFMYRSMTLDKEEVQKRLERYELYEQSYISKYKLGKVPFPTQYKGLTSRELYDIQTAKYDKLVKLIPKYGYHSRSGATYEMYAGTLKNFSKVTGSTASELAGYFDEAAKTGDITTFVGGNGQKYFVIFDYGGNGVLIGEDHRK